MNTNISKFLALKFIMHANTVINNVIYVVSRYKEADKSNL